MLCGPQQLCHEVVTGSLHVFDCLIVFSWFDRKGPAGLLPSRCSLFNDGASAGLSVAVGGTCHLLLQVCTETNPKNQICTKRWQLRFRRSSLLRINGEQDMILLNNPVVVEVDTIEKQIYTV